MEGILGVRFPLEPASTPASSRLNALSLLLLTLPQPSPPEAPRLVVILAVDQMVPEQLRRLAPRLTGGFRRFLDHGAVFWQATVDYAATETGPGHATLATGRYPSRHGIVGNLFLDGLEKKVVYCVGDGNTHPVTGAGVDAANGGASPNFLLGDGVTDILAARAPGSKSVTLAGKDRSAVLLGGRHSDLALWWDSGAGGFSSSTYYGEKLPEFVSVWNSVWKERARGWKWECAVAGDLSLLGTGLDDRPGEASAERTLPRTLPTDDATLARGVLNSPLVDFFTIELARLAVDARELGRDDVTDYLGISLSACDILGHGHGPDSVEVTDLLLRDDRELGRLLDHLDQSVGKGRWIACLSSDHGVLGLPETLQANGIGARRVPPAEVLAMQAEVRKAIAGAHPDARDLGLSTFELGFTFDEERTRAAGIDPAALRALIAEVVRETEWVADAYTREELESSEPSDPWVTLYRRSHLAQRSPDVTVRPAPWLLFDLPRGTSHGSPYPYDRGVPLAFLGGAIKAQDRYDPASTADAVPTLLALLGIQPPADLDGRALDID